MHMASLHADRFGAGRIKDPGVCTCTAPTNSACVGEDGCVCAVAVASQVQQGLEQKQCEGACCSRVW